MKVKFRVSGMTCAACSARVEKVTKQVEGVSSAEVNLLSGTMIADVDSGEITDRIIAAVYNAGYEASLDGVKKGQVANSETIQLRNMKKRLIGSFAFLIVLMYFTMGHMVNLPVPQWYHGWENAMVAALLQLLLTLPVVYLNRTYQRYSGTLAPFSQHGFTDCSWLRSCTGVWGGCTVSHWIRHRTQ